MNLERLFLIKNKAIVYMKFINIPAFLIFVPITTFMARVGANSVNKIDKSKVQSLFGVFLYVVGTIFIYRYLNL